MSITHVVLFILLSAFVGMVVAAGLIYLGYLLGFKVRPIDRRLELPVPEPEDDDTSAIVDVSPAVVKQRQAEASPDDDESAIVHVKTPRQIKADKERHETEELDRLTNGAIR